MFVRNSVAYNSIKNQILTKFNGQTEIFMCRYQEQYKCQEHHKLVQPVLKSMLYSHGFEFKVNLDTSACLVSQYNCSPANL